MSGTTPRRFLQELLIAGGAPLVGCGRQAAPADDDGDGDGGGETGPGPDGAAGDLDAGQLACGDAFAGGQLLGTVPFLDEGSPDFGVLLFEGLDARRYCDIGALTPETPVIPNDQFFVKTEHPLWSHRFDPPAAGRYEIALRSDDPTVRQRRLDLGWYVRVVSIDDA